MSTYGKLLEQHNIAIPEHLESSAEVPVLTGPQAQGDVGIFPIEKPSLSGFADVPAGGVAVVRGEAGGHTHWLDGEGDVRFAFADQSSGVALGELVVGVDATAWLTHEDEHGCNAMGPGVYAIRGKRELADEIRRVAD